MSRPRSVHKKVQRMSWLRGDKAKRRTPLTLIAFELVLFKQIMDLLEIGDCVRREEVRHCVAMCCCKLHSDLCAPSLHHSERVKEHQRLGFGLRHHTKCVVCDCTALAERDFIPCCSFFATLWAACSQEQCCGHGTCTVRTVATANEHYAVPATHE